MSQSRQSLSFACSLRGTLNGMTASPQDDAKKKKALQEFHNKSVQFAQEQLSKDTVRRAEHQADEESFVARGKQAVADEDTARAKSAEGVRRWKAGEKRQKEEILHDKQVRSARAKAQKEYKDKEREYEDKQRKYFNEMREKASKKAHADRAVYEKDQKLKADLLQVEKDAFTAKQKADADERVLKNTIEKDFLRKKEEVQRNSRAQRDALFAEENQKKIRLTGDALSVFQRDIQKRRADIDTEERRLLRQLETEAGKKRTDAEALTRKKRADIDAEMYRNKEAINQQRAKLK